MPELSAETTRTQAAETREQPFLYSWNRRVRHLHGISLRNINLLSGRPRAPTLAEDTNDVFTPAGSLVREERHVLQQSRSFDVLPVVGQKHKGDGRESPEPQGKPLKRPGKARRRSTMHWGQANPKQRQQKLEAMGLNRLCDTWISVHHPLMEKPVYISEIVEKSMNPTFSHFDLEHTPAAVSRSDSLILKVWAKNVQMEHFTLLVELSVNLRSLQFIGKSLETFHHPLPENCILFHLTDGLYTSFTDMPADKILEPQLRPGQRSIPQAYTASYDALMKLANIDSCIQDALSTRERLETEINAILAEQQQDTSSSDQLEHEREIIRRTDLAIAAERKQLEQLKKRKLQLQASRDERRVFIEEAARAQKEANIHADTLQTNMASLKNEIDQMSEQSSGQIRRICEGLLRIYPIEPIKDRSLQFTIRSIHLPNSVFDDTNRDEIAAALGYTGHLVHHLSLYLSIAIPYQIEPNGSSTFINDNISVSLAQRKFPLHPTNVQYKFEYGVFLLNKNIEFLLNRSGLRVVDIRHTLPNLKYLLYVLTAGTSELPMRKAGGIRGLWGGSITPALSRRGSEDSVTSVRSTDKEKRENITNGFGQGTNRVKGLPYRRNLLREAQ